VYYQGGGATLRAYSVDTVNGKLNQIAASSDTASGSGSFPVVSSNGATANTGVVWAIERGNPTEQLKAYDAVNLGAPLFAANAGNWSNGSRSYETPLVANGRVYVPAYLTVTVRADQLIVQELEPGFFSVRWCNFRLAGPFPKVGHWPHDAHSTKKAPAQISRNRTNAMAM
jgi:hypothetical protein